MSHEQFGEANKPGTPPTCKTCKHFRLHYIKFGKSYREISYGHCVYPRLKKRMTDTPACRHYKQRQKAL